MANESMRIGRVIAGNHDLTLDDDFCEKNPERMYFGAEDVLSLKVFCFLLCCSVCV